MGKILITGAAGFIGSQLAYRLKKDGEDIVLVDDFSYGREDNLIFDDADFREEIYRKDIRDTSSAATYNDRVVPEGCKIAFTKDAKTLSAAEKEQLKKAYEEGGYCYVK